MIVKNRFKYSALGILVLNISTIVLGVYLTWIGAGALGALLAIVVGHILYMLCTIFFLLYSTNYLGQLFIQIRPLTVRTIIKGSLLYGVMSMLGLIYFKVDTLLLSYNKGPGGEGGAHFKGRKHSEETIQKIKLKRKEHQS